MPLLTFQLTDPANEHMSPVNKEISRHMFFVCFADLLPRNERRTNAASRKMTQQAWSFAIRGDSFSTIMIWHLTRLRGSWSWPTPVIGQGLNQTMGVKVMTNSHSWSRPWAYYGTMGVGKALPRLWDYGSRFLDQNMRLWGSRPRQDYGTMECLGLNQTMGLCVSRPRTDYGTMEGQGLDQIMGLWGSRPQPD